MGRLRKKLLLHHTRGGRHQFSQWQEKIKMFLSAIKNYFKKVIDLIFHLSNVPLKSK